MEYESLSGFSRDQETETPIQKIYLLAMVRHQVQRRPWLLRALPADMNAASIPYCPQIFRCQGDLEDTLDVEHAATFRCIDLESIFSIGGARNVSVSE
jgi:hypothetical protein